MSYFVFSAILSIIILASIVFVAPLSDYLLRRVDKTAQGSLGHVVLRIAFGFFLISVLLALIAYIAGVLHPSTVTESPIISSISSQPFRQVILGFLFAVLFIVWLIESRRDQTKSEGGSAGTVPTTVTDAERDFIAIVGSAFGERGKSSAPSDPVSSRLWVALLGYLLVALFIIGSLDVFNVIAQKIESFKAGPGGVEFSFKEVAAQEKKAPQLALQTANSAESRSNNKTGGLLLSPPAMDLLAGLDGMMERDNRYIAILADSSNGTSNSYATPFLIAFARNYISPLATCHRSLWLISGSNRLARESFSELDEPAQELAHALQFGVKDKTDLIENLTKAYASAARRAVKQAYVDELDSLELAKQSYSKIKESHLDATQNEIKDGCKELLELVCLDGTKLLDADIPCEKTVSDQGLEVSFKTSLNDAWDSDSRKSEKPYGALISAFVSSTIGQNQAAIITLDNWLPHDINEDEFRDWYLLRLKLTMASLLEYWLRTDDIAAHNVQLQTYNLNLVGRLADDLERISDVSEAFMKYWARLPDDSVVEAYDGDQNCPLKYEPGVIPPDRNTRREIDKSNLGFTLITYMMGYVDRAFSQPDTFEKHSHRVHVMLRKLNRVDFGCLKLFGRSSPFKAGTLRAELYRLNALWKVDEYVDSEKLLTADAKHEKLIDALRIVDAGLGVLSESNEAETPSETKDYFGEYVSLSNAIETRSSLEALKGNLQNALSKTGD